MVIISNKLVQSHKINTIKLF